MLEKRNKITEIIPNIKRAENKEGDNYNEHPNMKPQWIASF